MKDVAKLAGVAPSTVSKYFYDPESLRPANRTAVENAIKKLNYTPNLLARNLRVKDSHTIAVVTQEVSNPFHATIYNTVRKEAAKQGYSVVLFSANDVDGQLESLFKSIPITYFSGVILCYFHDMEESFQFARNNPEVPIVIMSNDSSYCLEYPDIQNLYIEFLSGIYWATRHLLDLGATLISYIGCMTRLPDVEPKYAGFLKAMEEEGKEPYSSIRLQKEYTAETGYESMKIILERKTLPQAVLVDNDIMAIGALRCLADFKIKVPEDIMVVGCDDIDMARLYSPALTTIKVPIEEISICALELLMGQIAGEPVKEAPSFETTLIIRGTTEKQL